MDADRSKLNSRELLLRLDELEAVVRSTDRDFHKVEGLAAYIARSAPNGAIANLAMQAMSAAALLRSGTQLDGDRIAAEMLADILVKIRAALTAASVAPQRPTK